MRNGEGHYNTGYATFGLPDRHGRYATFGLPYATKTAENEQPGASGADQQSTDDRPSQSTSSGGDV